MQTKNQKHHPPTTPGAVYYTHGYSMGSDEVALMETIIAVQKRAVEYLDSNESNSDPRLRLVASRVAQWLPESIEHEAEKAKAAVRRIAIELDDLWYNHRDTMEKLTKGDEELDPKALERAMRPREEAEAAHKAPLFDITVKRDGQEISLDNGPIVIAPGSSKVVFTCKRRRAPAAQPTANATAAPRVAAADKGKASAHAAPITTTAPTTDDPATTEPISAGSNATSAAPRSKTPASRRAANKEKDAGEGEGTDSPNIPTPIPRATPEKKRKPSSRIEKAQIPALDLSGGAAEEEAPAPPQDDAAEGDAPEPAPVAGPSKPRRASSRKAASSKAPEPKAASPKPAKARAAAKAAATKAATKAATTKAAATKPAASKAATKPAPSKAADKKPVASRAPTPKAPEPQETAAGPSKPSANKRKRTEEVEEEPTAAEEARPTKGRKATKAQTTVEPARRSTRSRSTVPRD
ncbi:uncharacterized protein SCHCODRAFT_01214686 [Schizophyllum commune H4-8]|uniref:Uncharacterized protein n=1 Tax=Schizophyllum commune (strain H4-8 / FGSC 9210) TaxID=578458 RepID=D8Q8J5_SCHCM|nr:uncharacterized protein SCHCODRAFT_01214686 [Schizophyllum commune H4-8]KAI5890788.1 hypothetical protein SCHCODRAFT_01214686 [Schizophyllum commune H4-8]